MRWFLLFAWLGVLPAHTVQACKPAEEHGSFAFRTDGSLDYLAPTFTSVTWRRAAFPYDAPQAVVTHGVEAPWGMWPSLDADSILAAQDGLQEWRSDGTISELDHRSSAVAVAVENGVAYVFTTRYVYQAPQSRVRRSVQPGQWEIIADSELDCEDWLEITIDDAGDLLGICDEHPFSISGDRIELGNETFDLQRIVDISAAPGPGLPTFFVMRYVLSNSSVVELEKWQQQSDGSWTTTDLGTHQAPYPDLISATAENTVWIAHVLDNRNHFLRVTETPTGVETELVETPLRVGFIGQFDAIETGQISALAFYGDLTLYTVTLDDGEWVARRVDEIGVRGTCCGCTVYSRNPWTSWISTVAAVALLVTVLRRRGLTGTRQQSPRA